MKKIKNKKINIFKKSFLILAIFGLIFFNTISYDNNAYAESCSNITAGSDEYDKCMDDVRAALAKKAQVARDMLNIKNTQINTVQKQIALIDIEQGRNQVALQDVHEKFKTVSGQISDIMRRIDVEEKHIEQEKVILAGLMQSYYEDYQQGVLGIVLANQDFSDIINQADYVQQSSVKVVDVLKSIQNTKLDLDSQKIILEEKKDEHEKLQEKLEEKNLNLQSTENQKQVLLGQTKAEADKYQDLLSNIENEISNLEQNLAGTINYANLPPTKSGYFTWPVNPHIITQDYGSTSFAKTSGMYKNNFHNGYDFGIKFSNLYAVKGGKVVGSGDNGGYAYGKWLAIDHDDGLVTLYGHLSTKSVVKGSKVSEGQKIGVTGNTGNVYPRRTKSCPQCGAHLHFSVFLSNTFKTVESSYVKGLMIPTGAPVTPRKYL